ncbi:MAG TPA: acylphosphatase [Burkholderiales bacterium]|nr:acylphosphatase [Burkholderiales bacterium]
MLTSHLRITGRVQGVGFRESLQREAVRLSVAGWVRNRTDGSVEAVVQGSEAAVQRVIAWARRGPAAAHVATLTLTTAAARGDLERTYIGFDVLSSV